MITIQPHNWSKFQHYKARRPPWIKLHREMLDDFKWHSLPLASKALAPMLWLLASEHEQGIIMGDEVEIAFRLRISKQELELALNALKEANFFVDASMTLAGCLQLAPESPSESESEGETEIRGRRKRVASTPDGSLALAKKVTSPEEWQKRLDGYDRTNPRASWKPFWGPRPDEPGHQPLIPAQMLATWRAQHVNGHG